MFVWSQENLKLHLCCRLSLAIFVSKCLLDTDIIHQHWLLMLVTCYRMDFALLSHWERFSALIDHLNQKCVHFLQDLDKKLSTFFNLLKTYFKVAIKVAKRSNHEQVMKADNTFGWARAEIIGGLTNAIFLLALCVIIILESIEKFIQLWIQFKIGNFLLDSQFV